MCGARSASPGLAWDRRGVHRQPQIHRARGGLEWTHRARQHMRWGWVRRTYGSPLADQPAALGPLRSPQHGTRVPSALPEATAGQRTGQGQFVSRQRTAAITAQPAASCAHSHHQSGTPDPLTCTALRGERCRNCTRGRKMRASCPALRGALAGRRQGTPRKANWALTYLHQHIASQCARSGQPNHRIRQCVRCMH